MTLMLRIGLLAALPVCCGCGGGDGGGDAALAGVTILYRSQPLADVHVRLHETAGGPVLVESVSAASGVAAFERLPSPEPSRYVVSLESIGDGGWMLNPVYGDPAKSGLSIPAFHTNQEPTIALPDDAVRPLQPNFRR